MDLFVLSRPREILVVEDSAADTKMVLWALDKNKRGKSVVTLIDGEQVMAYLRRRCDGIPIVAFSTTQLPSDVRRCYELGANSFVCKPFELVEFQRAIGLIEDYWLRLSLAAG
jgi:CheY-like chemotaxis protein